MTDLSQSMDREIAWPRKKYLATSAVLIAVFIGRSIPQFHLRGLPLWSAGAILAFLVCVAAWHVSGDQR